MSLAQLSSLYLPAIENELRQAVGAGPEHLREYYAMMEYHLGWEAGGSSGKRLRPLLCLLTCAAAGGEWQRALPIAAALELLHNFSLIHDDIQDNSPLRRGRPTVWARWGQAQAINAGDAMFTLAHLVPHQLPAHGVSAVTALQALEIFDRTSLALTQGQYLDMDFEQRACVTVAQYLTMIEGKTAALVAACASLGALLGGANDERRAHFEAYGRYLGLAFQIQDDLLGIWGDPTLTGKSAASDLEKRKKSLPVVFGLERSEAFATAYAAPTQPNESVAEWAAQLEGWGARTFTEQLAHDFMQRASDALNAAAPQEPAASALRELTAQLLQRNF